MIKKKLLVLPVEVKQREYLSKLYLGLMGARSGYQVVLCSHDDKSLSYIGNGAYLYKDHAVVSEKRLYKIKESGHKLFSLDEEGLIYISKEAYWQNRVSENWVNNSEVLFCWGEEQEKLIKEKCPNAYCVPVGNPRFDLLHYIREVKSKKVSSSGLNVLINTRFASINMLGGELEFINRLYSLGVIRTEADKEYYENHQRNDRKIFEEFKSLIEEILKIKGCNVIVRPHPAESSDIYKKIFSGLNIEVDDGEELVKQLEWADILVHDGCTTAIEGMISGVKVLGLRPSNISYSYGELANNFSHLSFSNSKSLALHIESIINNKVKQEEGMIKKLDVAGKKIPVAEFINSWDNPHAASKILEYISSFKTPSQALISKKYSVNIKESVKLLAYEVMKRNSQLLPSRFFPNKIKNFIHDKEVSLSKFDLIKVEEVMSDVDYLVELLGLSSPGFRIEKIAARSFLIYCE